MIMRNELKRYLRLASRGFPEVFILDFVSDTAGGGFFVSGPVFLHTFVHIQPRFFGHNPSG